MIQYEIVLINEKERSYIIISWLLLFANLISIVLLTIAMNFHKVGPLILAIIAIAIIFLAKYFKRPNKNFSYYFPFFFFSLAWFLTPYIWLGFINLLFGALNTIARKKLIVQFYNDKVVYPSAFPKKMPWNEITNVILKDGMLTLDLKNNKLLQQKIDRAYTTINEEEFNDFCRQQLKEKKVI